MFSQVGHLKQFAVNVHCINDCFKIEVLVNTFLLCENQYNFQSVPSEKWDYISERGSYSAILVSLIQREGLICDVNLILSTSNIFISKVQVKSMCATQNYSMYY